MAVKKGTLPSPPGRVLRISRARPKLRKTTPNRVHVPSRARINRATRRKEKKDRKSPVTARWT
jgi:hypothetical protein